MIDSDLLGHCGVLLFDEMEHSPAPTAGNAGGRWRTSQNKSPDAAAQPGLVRQDCAMQMAQRWRRVFSPDGTARCAQELANWKKQLAGRSGTDWHVSARLLVRPTPAISAGESPLHQGRVSARLTGLRQRAASARELTQRSAGK